jgi:type IV pilus assembly protein PilO
MGNLQATQKRFTLMLAILGAISLGLLVYLLWPGSSVSARIAQEQELQQRYRLLQREVAPVKEIREKLVQTRKDIKDLYQENVPTHYSQISQEVLRLVRETGVSSQSIRYTPQNDRDKKGELPDVQRIEIDTTITGDYAKVARFVNALEQNKMFFVVNQISLSGQQEGSLVTLQIKFETFVKQTGQAAGA